MDALEASIKKYRLPTPPRRKYVVQKPLDAKTYRKVDRYIKIFYMDKSEIPFHICESGLYCVGEVNGTERYFKYVGSAFSFLRKNGYDNGQDFSSGNIRPLIRLLNSGGKCLDISCVFSK